MYIDKLLIETICHELGHSLAICKINKESLLLISILDTINGVYGKTLSTTREEEVSLFVLLAGFVMESVVQGKDKIIHHKGTDISRAKTIADKDTISQTEKELLSFLIPYKDRVLSISKELEERYREKDRPFLVTIEKETILELYNS